MGKTIKWKEWIVKEIGITDRYARKLKRVASVLGPFPRFRELVLSFSEVYGLVTAIEYMLASDNKIAEFWMHKSTVDTVPASGPIGPLVDVESKSAAVKPQKRKKLDQNRFRPY